MSSELIHENYEIVDMFPRAYRLLKINPKPHSEDLRQWWGKGKPERRAKNVFCLDEDDCIDGMIAKILKSE